MRENNYVTMMDPFQKKYGNVMSSVLIFPTLVADVLWVARTLVSLGELLHLATLPAAEMCAHVHECTSATLPDDLRIINTQNTQNTQNS